MEARLTPRRLLMGAAALVALVAVTSGCGGGTDAQAAAKTDPKLVTYSNSLLSFSHPAAWKAYPFRWAGELHFRPMVYLSTQPVAGSVFDQGEHDVVRLPCQAARAGRRPRHLEREQSACHGARAGLAGPGRRPRGQARGHSRRDVPQHRRRPDGRRPDRRRGPCPPRPRSSPRACAGLAWRRKRRASTRCSPPRSSPRSSSRALARRSWSD